MKEEYRCARCGYVGEWEVQFDGFGNALYRCPECEAGEKDMEEHNTIKKPNFNADGFDESYDDVCGKCKTKLTTGNFEVYCPNAECEKYDENVYFLVEDEVKKRRVQNLAEEYKRVESDLMELLDTLENSGRDCDCKDREIMHFVHEGNFAEIMVICLNCGGMVTEE